jgi:5-methyltetrahydropteroyltriglutamate--homocysteine methyltransferase
VDSTKVSTAPPYRADHVGSLLRPEEVLRARAGHAAGTLTSEQLREVEDRAIQAVVREQEAAGLRTATDGEFRRTYWHSDFIGQLGGIEVDTGQARAVEFHNEGGTITWHSSPQLVRGKVRLGHTIFGEDFQALTRMVRTATPKLTIPSPSMVHFPGAGSAIDPAVYPDLEEFWADLSGAYADEVRGLVALGCRYLQLDDTSLAYLNDPRQRARIAERGGDPDRQHLRYVKQINAALRDRPAELAVTTHLCRGNFRSSWGAEGGYDHVAEALFSELDVDGFFLEFDDARSGGFAPLRFIPAGKRVVLGLVTTKRGTLESKEDLKRRIDEAARYVPLDQLCLSPQCGFSSTVDGNALTHEEQQAKLALIVDTALDVWGAL